MDDKPVRAEELHEELQALDRTLRETRRRAHNRKAQHLAIEAISHLADLKFPTGLGGEIDNALILPAAEAIMLHRTLKRAQRIRPTRPQDVDAVIDGINHFLQVLRRTRADLLSIRKQ
jgi:hypothetical protein